MRDAPTKRPLRLGLMVSKGGRTAANLVEHLASEGLPATAAVAIGHHPHAPAVERVRRLGVPFEAITSPPLADLDECAAAALSDRIDETLDAAEVDLVCLCGYLRRFRVGDRWAGRAINIHPSLLPEFGGPGFHGLAVHRAVLAAGRTETGCTVHWIDEAYDRGEILLQRRCPVEPGDTPESLAARVFREECLALPEAVARIAREGLPRVGGDGENAPEPGCPDRSDASRSKR